MNIDPHNLLGARSKLPTQPQPYVRPADWLAMPAILPGDDKMVGLFAVTSDSPAVALIAAGNYTVDWGDGVVENFAANAVASHVYDFSNVLLDGTITTRGYKQAIITITPQSGQQLTLINLHEQHPRSTSTYPIGKRLVNWLDIAVACANLTTLHVASKTYGADPAYIAFNLLEQFNLVRSNLKILNYMFRECISLRSIIALETSLEASQTITFPLPVGTSNTFTAVGHGLVAKTPVVISDSALPITSIDIGGTLYVQNVVGDTFRLSYDVAGNSLFSGTWAGESITLVAGNVANGVFYQSGIRYLPSMAFPRIISTTSMFNSCMELTHVGAIDLTSSITCDAMFANCSMLQTVQSLHTPNAVMLANLFTNDYALDTTHLSNTSNCVNFSGMYGYCRELSSAPMFDTSKGKLFGSMFSETIGLKTIPQYDLSAGLELWDMFGFSGITTVPALNLASATDLYQMFNGCQSLRAIPTLNMPNVLNCGWMFANCSSITEVPMLQVGTCTNFANMFSSCRNLRKVADLPTQSGDDFQNMFRACESLTELTLTNTGAGTNFAGFVQLASNLLTLSLNIASSTSLFSAFASTYSLASITLTNIPASTTMIDVASSNLSAAAINALYTSLPVVTGSHTINVGGNWGAASDTISIALTKGWTVGG